jgi:hypothetical protein
MAVPGGNHSPWGTEPRNLRDRIANASAELKLARRDGAADWIAKAAKALDDCIDEIPRANANSST